MAAGLESAATAVAASSPTAAMYSPQAAYKSCELRQEHQEIWATLSNFFQCADQGATDPVHNLLTILVMLFSTVNADVNRMENYAAVEGVRARHMELLRRYLTVQYNDELAQAKMNVFGILMDKGKDFYDIHKKRVYGSNETSQ